MDLYLKEARYRDAMALTSKQESVPALAVRRLLAERGLGEDISATVKQFDLRFRAWLAAHDYRHAREMAMFYLDLLPQLDIALQVAQKNATLQREPEDIELLHRARKLQHTAKGI